MGGTTGNRRIHAISAPSTTPSENLVAVELKGIRLRMTQAISKVIQRLLQPISLTLEHGDPGQNEMFFVLILNRTIVIQVK